MQLTTFTAQCKLFIKSQISIANIHELQPWHTFHCTTLYSWSGYSHDAFFSHNIFPQMTYHDASFFPSSKYPFSVLNSSYSCALFGYRKFKRVGPENGISQLVARIPLLSMLISINATYFCIQLHFHFIHFRMHGQHCCWCCCCCCLKITFYCLEKKKFSELNDCIQFWLKPIIEETFISRII